MKKGVLFFLTIIFVVFFTTLAFSEEYVVAKGDDLNAVLDKTKSTKEQLQCLNPGTNLDRLQPNQVVLYISGEDQKRAVQRCWDKLKDYSPEGCSPDKDLYRQYKREVGFLQDWLISYKSNLKNEEEADIPSCQRVLILSDQEKNSKK